MKQILSDYELTVKIRNNRILQRIRDTGYDSQAAFCRATGISYQIFSDLVTMRLPATLKDGRFSKVAVDLATALGVEPEDLFTVRQAAGGVKSTIVRHIEEDDIIYLDEPGAELLIDDRDLDEDIDKKKIFDAALRSLKDQERDIVESIYGTNDKPQETADEIAGRLGLSSARVKQIEGRAINKLKLFVERWRRKESISLAQISFSPEKTPQASPKKSPSHPKPPPPPPPYVGARVSVTGKGYLWPNPSVGDLVDFSDDELRAKVRFHGYVRSSTNGALWVNHNFGAVIWVFTSDCRVIDRRDDLSTSTDLNLI